MNRRELALVQRIADLAWRDYDRAAVAREIYRICRDELKVRAGERQGS